MRFIFILCMGLVFSFIANAQEIKTWDYPVKPGMEEWNQLETEQSWN
jgi:hypothetical protein